MKSISIYALTRKQNIEHLQKLEQQLSGREHTLKMKEWELESMRALVNQLELHMQNVSALRLFYSFQIPRLGKEFDMMHLPVRKNQNGYPHVSVVYANDAKEADTLVQDYVRQGYQYFPKMGSTELGITAVRDTEKMVVVLDERYYYDEDQYLRSRNPMQNGQSEVRRLFHLLNQAKENLVFVVKGNETVYGILLDMK